MTAAIPYLTVSSIERLLILSKIDCPVTIRPGVYPVRLGDSWIPFHAVEPRISTGAAPLRALHLRAADEDVLELLRLEEELLTGHDPLQLKYRDDQVVQVSFESLRGTLYLRGAFRGERDDSDAAELEYSLALEERALTGWAQETTREGRRMLILGELPLDEAMAIARAFDQKKPLLVNLAAPAGSQGSAEKKPLEEYPLPLLIEAFAHAVVKQQGLDGAELHKHASELQGQVQSLVKRFQLKLAEARQQQQSSSELEQLLDGIARTGTAAGRLIAEHRGAIAQAFHGVDLARMSDGIGVLTAWLRRPTGEPSKLIQDLLSELYAALGAVEAREEPSAQGKPDPEHGDGS